MSQFTNEDLLAYADEALLPEASSAIENALRTDSSLLERLRVLMESRDQGVVAIAEVWRHARLSCPTRSELGLYCVGAIEAEMADYITFHIEQVGCVYCAADLAEMQQATADLNAAQQSSQRRDSLFASSAGLLKSSAGKE